jgi:hypothetical protein
MDPMNRRSFLKNSMLTAGMLMSGCNFSFLGEKRGIALGSGKMMKGGKPYFVLSVMDLNKFKQDPIFIPLHFFAHGITPHPTNPDILTLFEKKGPGACEVNIKTKRVLRMIETVENRYFYGHSVYSKDGSLLYSTEATFRGESGVIAIRDTKTMKIIGEFPSYGKAPHDLKMIDNGATLVVTNGGGRKGSLYKGDRPNVAYVDIKTQKEKDIVEFPNENINAGHLSLSSKMDLVVVSAPRDGQPSMLGGVSFKPSGKPVITANEPADIIQKMKAESLSIALHESTQIVGVTNPDGNILTFWNYKTGKFLKAIEMSMPRSLGITKDQKHFVLGHGQTANVSLINVESLEIEKDFQKFGAGFSGSHLLII